MIASLGILLLGGLAAAEICRKCGLPRIVGMLAAGIALGPCALNLLDGELLSISAALRQMALIVILAKAGLALNTEDLRAVGRPAALMSFVPACFEIAGYVLAAPRILNITVAEAAVMGAVMGAVSPAVVVPKMVALMDEGRGTKKRIPQLILAGASLDDVFVIVLFASFLGLVQGESVSARAFLQIPVSVIAGVALGAGVGLLMGECFRRSVRMSDGMRAILVLAFSFLLVAAEDWLEGIVPVSGLLAVMSMTCALKLREEKVRVERISKRFGEIWMAAEVVLFVLVGAAVDVRYTLNAGLGAAAVILIALAFRSAGVWVSLIGTNLNRKEKLFSVIAYLPKATVQAAIGGVPLTMGLPCGQAVLSTAVLAILITAPLGAIGMDLTEKRLLSKN